jgi:ATP-dependent exoDNAse (exonuclease V) beta subunit
MDGDKRNVRDPLIRSFKSFDDLEAASEKPGNLGRDLRQVVRIILEFRDRLSDIISLLRAKPGARNEIIMTTAHKSKGLEWPQVALMSDFDQTLSAENDTSLSETERDEELNLLYVAATRATERLSIRGEYLKSIARDAALIGPG